MFRPSRLPAPLAALLFAIVAALPVTAGEPLTEAQKDAVRALVRETLVNNPEILAEAIQALQAREQAAEAARQKAAIQGHRAAIFENPNDPVLGNPEGSVTLVEFFDYRCTYCKSVFEPLMDLIEEDGDIRFVVKEFPILGPESVLAARYALAAREQGKYAPYHTALMRHRGAFNEEVLQRIAGDVGLDARKLAEDANDPGLKALLRDNMQLARILGISGTPAFVIGDTLIPGAVSKDELKATVEAVRRTQKNEKS